VNYVIHHERKSITKAELSRQKRNKAFTLTDFMGQNYSRSSESYYKTVCVCPSVLATADLITDNNTEKEVTNFREIRYEQNITGITFG
jgi:hypothetical protein